MSDVNKFVVGELYRLAWNDKTFISQFILDENGRAVNYDTTNIGVNAVLMYIGTDAIKYGRSYIFLCHRWLYNGSIVYTQVDQIKHYSFRRLPQIVYNRI